MTRSVQWSFAFVHQHRERPPAVNALVFDAIAEQGLLRKPEPARRAFAGRPKPFANTIWPSFTDGKSPCPGTSKVLRAFSATAVDGFLRESRYGDSKKKGWFS